MTDVEILKECRLATMEERALAKQIQRLSLIGGPAGVGSQAMSPAGDRKTNNRQAALFQQLEGLIQKLDRKREEDIEIILKAEDVIGRIISRNDKMIIRYYYIEGQSDYEIADELDVVQQTVNKRRNIVLEALEKNIRAIVKIC